MPVRRHRGRPRGGEPHRDHRVPCADCTGILRRAYRSGRGRLTAFWQHEQGYAAREEPRSAVARVSR